MRRFRPFVEVVAAVGFIVLIAAQAGWLPSSTPAPVLIAAYVAMFFGGSLLVVADVWAWVRKRFPTRQRREAMAAEAGQLGLRSLDSSTLDLSFPFVRPARHAGWLGIVGRASAWLALIVLASWLALGYFAGLDRQSADTRTAMVAAAAVALLIAILLIRDFVLGRAKKGEPLEWFMTNATRPRAGRSEQIFAGTWKGVEVQVFDYRSLLGSFEGEWTCAILPLVAGGPAIEIARGEPKGRWTPYGRSPAIGKDARAPLRLVSENSRDADRVIDSRVRSQLDADRDAWDLIQLQGGRMLFCRRRVLIHEREPLLEAALRIRDALP